MIREQLDLNIFFELQNSHIILVPSGDAYDIVITELATAGDGSLAGDLCY